MANLAFTVCETGGRRKYSEVGSIATSGLSGTGLPALPSAVGKTARDSAGAVLYDGSSRTASPGGAGAVSTAPVQLWRQSAGHPIEQLHRDYGRDLLARSDAALAVLDGLPFGIIVIDAGTGWRSW